MPSDEQLERWISEIGREIGLRMNVYPKWIKDGKMNATDANRHKRNMDEIYDFFKSMRTREPDNVIPRNDKIIPESPKDALANW